MHAPSDAPGLARSPRSLDAPPGGLTYGRSRLLLGISGVGAWVVLATIALLADLPDWLARQTGGGLAADVLAVAGLAAFVALVQAPFDLLGGHVLPRRHGRTADGLARFAARWLRGTLAHAGIFLLVGVVLLVASRWLGAPGMVVAAAGAGLLLLAARAPMARAVGGLVRVDAPPSLGADVEVLSSTDVGFTGGTIGVLRARRHVLPERWIETLDPETLGLALRRRRDAVISGLWLRGRVGALLFTWAGLAIAGARVGDPAGTAGGVLVFAAVFTLWSFVGLLVLPTLSRRASLAVDGRLVDRGIDPLDLGRLASRLDAMQDGEPSRPGWIESIFHPIPSVSSRGPSTRRNPLAAWDIARTASFLGIAGLSPLGRAVHCNSGRPSLWVYLPID